MATPIRRDNRPARASLTTRAGVFLTLFAGLAFACFLGVSTGHRGVDRVSARRLRWLITVVTPLGTVLMLLPGTRSGRNAGPRGGEG